MTTVAVAEKAESAELHGFFTRSRKVGIVLVVIGVAVAVGLGLGVLGSGSTAEFDLNITAPKTADFHLPAQATVVALGILAVAGGAALLLSINTRLFAWLTGLSVTAAVLALLVWAVSVAKTDLPVESALSLSIVAALPLIYGSLAGVVCERSGVINVGIEGQLLAGAFTGAFVGTTTHSAWIGMIAAALSGAVVTFLLAALAIRFLVDQVVIGVLLNLLVLGVTGVVFDALMQPHAGTYNDPVAAPHWQVPMLADIPVIGPAIFRQNVFVYGAIVLVVAVWLLLFKTRWGLRTRSVGEHPAAADSVGIKVNALRFRNVVLAGLISGFGGALFTIGSDLGFSKNMTVGKGFIALAVLIVGRWNPLGALAGALLFGFADYLQGFLSSVEGGFPVPSEFIKMLPYVVTIIAVAGLIGRVRAPAADGKPYIKS